MIKFNRTLLLFIVIIIEGYVVLSTELLAIRQTIPFVGSGTDTVSIIIAAVLMPLAFGYYFGGRWRPKRFMGKLLTVRKKLILNIIISAFILLVGMSYTLLNGFFITLINLDLTNRIALTTVYSLLFLVVPVYLLGQTIPLVSNFFTSEKLSAITGRMLFFSTVGSFMGAVFSTLVLMATIGVHYTVCVNFILMAILVTLLSKKKTSEMVLVSYTLVVCAFFLNSTSALSTFNIVENNKYNTISVFRDKQGMRNMSINNNASSRYNDAGRKHEYIEFIERIAIDPIRNEEKPRDILVIGAGAFTFGHEDGFHHYDYVDIDKALRKVAEEYILKSRLKDNKTFYPIPARAYLTKTKKKYDLIMLDAFLGDLTIPEHLVTVEFFAQVKEHLKEKGVVIANFGSSPNFLSPFSRHLDNTFRTAFPHISRHVVLEKYKIWDDDPGYAANSIYIYRNQPDNDSDELYTDNKNRIFYDKPHSKPNYRQLKKAQ
ncbi:MAG: hypothetical protein DHS20C02_09110 [Micavibrio sp.]|nr:MAG: hypothetical protein DHS20C02_09110 [Micavibrio sp.]